jgi:hypothetical protein
MLLLESYAKNYWKFQTRFLEDKPATQKLVKLLLQRNDKFSRQVLVEMMQLREEDTNSEELLMRAQRAAKDVEDSISSFIFSAAKKSDKEYFLLLPSLARQIKFYLNKYSEMKRILKDKTPKIEGYEDEKEVLKKMRMTANSTLSTVEKIYVFAGGNASYLDDQIKKYKLPFWGIIILTLVLIVVLTIKKYGKQNLIKKIILNTLKAAITGFSLALLVVAIKTIADMKLPKET